jgi:N-acetylglucosamine malate deacetylase 1
MLIRNIERVLVLSPHTDDAELGAGGTIARFIDEGKEVYCIVFSKCVESLCEGLPADTLEKEFLKSMSIMGIPPDRLSLMDYGVRKFPEYRQEILEDIIKLKQMFKPDLVLVPSSQDMHQDHGTIYWEAIRAFKKETSIWGYEHPWNNLTFTTHIFVKLSPEQLERKLNALKQYQSQGHRGYMDERAVRSLAYTRGAQLDIDQAEAFELVRLIF